MSVQSITIVYNAKSGSSMDIDRLKEIFTAQGLAIESTIAIDSALAENVQPVIDAAGYIAAVGGDGTISAVANSVAGTKATLIPLPGGTLNHFTKDLGVEQDLTRAIAAIPQATLQSVDVASVNDTVFINNSSIGIYPQSLQTRTRIEEKLGKWPAAVVGMYRALVRFKVYTVEIDGHIIRTPFVFVGNNNYALEDIIAGGRTSLTQGILSVYVVRSDTRFALVRIFFAALRGTLQDSEECVAYQTAHLRITSRKHTRLHVSHDGEVSTLQLPLVYSTQKASLRVLCPTPRNT